MYEVIDFTDSWKPIETTIAKVNNLPSEYEIKCVRVRHNSKHVWDQFKIEIYKNGEYYFHFNRNFFDAPFFYYMSIPDEDGYINRGKEYLITSGNYQTLTIINLTDKTMNSYCLGQELIGEGFCPTNITKQNDTLKIEGNFWGDEDKEYILIDAPKDFDLDKFKFPKPVKVYYLSSDKLAKIV